MTFIPLSRTIIDRRYVILLRQTFRSAAINFRLLVYKIREKKLPMALQRAVVRDNSATARRLSSACRVPIGLELPSTGSLCFFEEKLGVFSCRGGKVAETTRFAAAHIGHFT